MAWWGFNCDFPDIHMQPKFHCYPLGLTQVCARECIREWHLNENMFVHTHPPMWHPFMQWWGARNAMQRAFDEGVARLHWEKPIDPAAEEAAATTMFLANYEVANNREKREAAHKHFCEGPLANYSSCTSSNNKDLLAYFRRIREHMFNVAPMGVGLDCYRCVSWACCMPAVL